MGPHTPSSLCKTAVTHKISLTRSNLYCNNFNLIRTLST